MIKDARKSPRKSSQRGKVAMTKMAAAVATAAVNYWSTDPRDGLLLMQEEAPDLPGETLPTEITGTKPDAALYSQGTAEFRYWVAAVALRRAANFWASLDCTAWNPAIGDTLPVGLDVDIQLNAYYSRQDGLSFFHDTVSDTNPVRPLTVYSGESPDVLTHELGHAVLDALKPELWGINTTEAAGFHESFGDMSAILTALQVPQVRQVVLNQTQGQLGRNSSLSRLAEDLGHALNLRFPGAAEVDSLRNAANSWVYHDPASLPVNGPATTLTSESHNFSRIFTGAFLEMLGGIVLMLADNGMPTTDHLLQASHEAGKLLVRAVQNAPLRTRFFLAVAEQLLIANDSLFGGRYATPITKALVRHGLLSLPAVAAAHLQAAATPRFAYEVAFAAGGTNQLTGITTDDAAKPVFITIDGRTLGLTGPLLVGAPAIDDNNSSTQSPLGVFSIAATVGTSTREQAVQSYVQGLALRGKIEIPKKAMMSSSPLTMAQSQHTTHRLVVATDGTMQLERVRVDCQCCS